MLNRLTRPRPAPARSAFIPAPTKGWDDESNIAAEDKFKALKLDNWFPQPEYVELRRGHKQHSTTGETVPVNTLMTYHAPNSANDKLFSVANDTIYDASSVGAGSATSITTLSNSRLQWVNFTTSGGSYLYAVNGANNPVYYDGSSWANPAITGVDESTFIHVNVFKDRLFFIPVNSTKFWYLAVDSIAGAATDFQLGGLMSRGGHLVAMGSITIDGGSGPDDHAVFITSKGQVIVYQGSDPSDANAWSLVGVYEIPPPIGYRCLAKIAGDLGILTIAGVLPLSKAMVIDRAAVQNIAISQNINTTLMKSAQDYGDNYGWGLTVYPKNNMFIVNVPLAEGGETHQYVMNTRHGAWCRFLGQNAASWAVYKDRLFFGGVDGKVYEADCVAEDNGEAILADMVTSYNFFGSRANIKQFKMIRPHIVSDGQVGSAIKLYAEWGSHERGTPPNNYLGGGSIGTLYWDDGRDWDDGSLWPENRTVTQKWRSISALGRSAAIRMRVQAESSLSTPIVMQVSGFDVIYENGGLI
jgi:hypothetical protein